MKILVVDNESVNRESLEAVLATCKHQVEVAKDATETLRIAESFSPDAAIVDLHLGPPMNGDVLAAELRQRYPALRIIVISGLSSVDPAALKKLDISFLAKPFQLSALLPLLEKD